MQKKVETAATQLADAESALSTAKGNVEAAKQQVHSMEIAVKIATDKFVRADGLSYNDALKNDITDMDFIYLNEYIANVKKTPLITNAAAEKLQAAQQKLEAANATYNKAAVEYAMALANLATAQSEYDRFLPTTVIGDDTNDKVITTEKVDVTQVTIQNTTQNTTQNTSSKAVETGDPTHTGAFGLAAIVSAMVMTINLILKRRQDD